MIKLVVSDVDGTLVKDGTLEINPEYMDVIKKLTEKGIHFVACSGRQYSSDSLCLLFRLFTSFKLLHRFLVRQ